MPLSAEEIAALNERHASSSIEEVVRTVLALDPSHATLALSLSVEDTVLLHVLAESAKALGIQAHAFALDTGRLPEETYQILDEVRQKYSNVTIDVLFPDATAVEKLMRIKGPYSFYESVENRKECCHIRKVEPLGRVLKGKTSWMTGLRREQSVTRADIALFERDDAHEGMLKVSPLASWSEPMVYDYAKAHNVPVHPLHRRGFPSIGCEPCTRAVQPGEDIRAGRWWWENADQKECGLHSS
ncbi:MAG: phosphoadenylyl-sulfate reductase [Spirochaetia bacterium]|nr:phosphoadenylyl-sulfate reductase [Spirochaetia bacterium]